MEAFFAQLLVAMISSIAIIVLALIAAWVAGNIYDANHSIPNSLQRGDDLGGGLVVVLSGLGSMMFSIPISIVFRSFVIKKMKGIFNV